MKLISSIEDVCRRYHVDMKPPENIEKFQDELKKFRYSIKKASSLVFEYIESDIIEKSTFLN